MLQNRILKCLILKRSVLVIIIAFVTVFSPVSILAQVRKSFTQRTSLYSPEKVIYNIKGDYTLIGNTNLTLSSYGNNINNSNNNMIFVDVDDDPNTVNSSQAQLTFSTENDANPDCSEILYAGLYWSGRAHTSSGGSNAVTIGGTNNNYTYNASGTNIGTYRLFITSTGSGTGNITYYSFCPTNGGDTVVFAFTGGTRSTYVLTVKVGANTPSVVSASLPTNLSVNDNSNRVATLTSPYNISDGTTTLMVNSLQKRTSPIPSSSSFANVNLPTKVLYKNQVKLKHEAGGYSTITANINDILYPVADNEYMYVAYAEVTDYVKEYGLGHYYVADMALVEGLSDGTGYYGGWGMVVIYQNSKMKWRDVTVFDGYAHVDAGNTNVVATVSGFNAVQMGDVKMKLGIMAAEGDCDITGDYMQIMNQRGNYENLVHSLNSTNNFFNSSINTGNNGRNPSLTNNTGIDIAMFNINNPDNSVIANKQTSTSFRFNSTQDAYVPFCLAMAVDAYIPEAEAFTSLVTLEGIEYDPVMDAFIVKPGDSIVFNIEARNRGSESVLDAVFSVDIPFTVEYVSHTADYFSSPMISGTTLFDALAGASGKAIWTLNQLPAGYPDSVYARFKLTVKVTDDCYMLAAIGEDCHLPVSLTGTISGKTAIMGVNFENNSFISGYETEGVCVGNPIHDPIKILIDRAVYVNEHCGDSIYKHRIFSFCDLLDGHVPLMRVSVYYPPGTRFYDQYPPSLNTTEYTVETGIPVNGSAVIYAIYPSNNESACYGTLSVDYQPVTIPPPAVTLRDTIYCVNGDAVPLSHHFKATDEQFTLYFYRSKDGTAERNIIPSSATAGTFTYYARQAMEGCTGAFDSVTVVVESPITFIVEGNQTNVCYGTEVSVTAVPADGIFSYDSLYNPYITVRSNVITLSDSTPMGSYSVRYTAPIESLDPNSPCKVTDLTQIISMTVNDTTVPGHIVPSFQDICIGSMIQDLIIQDYQGTVLRWECSSDGISWESIPNNTYELPSNTIETTMIYRAYLQNGNCTPVYTQTAVVNLTGAVAPNPPIITTPQFTCYGQDYTIAMPELPEGSNYRWYLAEYGGETDATLQNITMRSGYITRWVSIFNGMCEGLRSLVSIRKMIHTGSIASTGQTACYLNEIPDKINSLVDATLMDGNSGEIEYQWRVAVNGIDAGQVLWAEGKEFTPSDWMNRAGRFVFTRWVKNSICNVWEPSAGAWTLIVGPPDPTITMEPPHGTVCEGTIVKLTLAAIPANRYFYQWYLNGVAIPEATNRQYLTSLPGQYTVRVTHRESGCDSITPMPEAAQIQYDVAAPIIEGTMLPDTVKSCTQEFLIEPLADLTVAWLETKFKLQISDNVTADKDLTVTSEIESVRGRCPITVVRRYTITDLCGNSAFIDHAIEVVDDSSPVMKAQMDPQIAGFAKQNCLYTVPDVESKVRELAEDNCTTNENLIIIQNLPPGTLIFSDTVLRVTVSDACHNVYTTYIPVSLPDSLDADITTFSHPVCYGGYGSATVQPTKGLSPYFYEWDNHENDSTAVLLMAGMRYITVTDANGCTVTKSVTLSEPAALNVTASVANHYVCVDGTIILYGSATGAFEKYQYQWKDDNNLVLGTNDSVYVSNTYSPGEHVFVLSVTDSVCGMITDSVTVVIQSLPVIISNQSIVDDTLSVCSIEKITLTATPAGVTRKWSYKNNEGGGGAFFAPSSSGDTSVYAKTGIGFMNIGWYFLDVSQAGCQTRDSIYINVKEDQKMPSLTVNIHRDTIVVQTVTGAETNNSITEIEYSRDLWFSFTHPIVAKNVQNCGFEYRIYKAATNSWSNWTEWVDTATSVTIESSEILIGYSVIQLKHLSSCADSFCGVRQIYEYSFRVLPSKNSLHGTQDIDEFEICMSQDSVRLINIFENGFTSSFSQYQYRYCYSTGSTYHYQSEWIPLNKIGDTLETITVETDKIQYIPFTPWISVKNNPHTLNHVNDVISMSIRVVTENLRDGDTTWNISDTVNYQWKIIANPYFSELLRQTMVDTIVCHGTTTDSNVVKLLAYPDENSAVDSVSWYYAPDGSTIFEEIILQGTVRQYTPLFTYRTPLVEYPNNRGLAVYDFVNQPDTIVFMAALHSMRTSCPIAYDTIRIQVQEDNSLDLKRGSNEQILCRDHAMDEIVYETGGGAIDAVIKWISVVPAGIGFEKSFENENEYKIQGTPSVSGNYQYVLSTVAGNKCTAVLDTGHLIVNPLIELISIPDRVIYSGETVNTVQFNPVEQNMAGKVSCQWNNNNSSIGLNSSGVDSIASFYASNLTSLPVSATITVHPFYSLNEVTCEGIPTDFMITVNPLPQVVDAMYDTICSGETFQITPVDGIHGIIPAGTLYSWNAPTVSGITGLLSGINQSSINGTLHNTTNHAIEVKYQIMVETPGYATSDTFVATVVVLPLPAIDSIFVTASCNGVFSVIPTTGTNGIVPEGTVYEWQADTLSGVTGISSGKGAVVSDTLMNHTNKTQRVIYTVRPVSGECKGSAFIMTVIVHPLPQITNISHDVCSENRFEILPVNGINGVVPVGTTYSWGLPAVVANITGYTAGIEQSTITGMLRNDTTIYRYVLYQVIPAFGGCKGTPFDITVRVKPVPVIPSQNAKVCSGVDFTFSSPNIINGKIPDNTLYSWPAPVNSGGIVGMNGAQNNVTQIRDTFFNNVNAVATVTYLITPSTDGCQGVSFNTIVVVHPAAKISHATRSICSGSTFSVKPPNGAIPPNTTYSWSAPILSGITDTKSKTHQDSIYDTPVNSTLRPLLLSYHIIPTSGSEATGYCVGNSFKVDVNIYPVPRVNLVNDQRVCPDNEVAINFSSPTVQAGRSYYWKNNNPAIGLDSSGRGNISFTAISTEGSNAPDTAVVSVYSTYTVSEAGICKGNTTDFQIVVIPALSLVLSDDTVCPNAGQHLVRAVLDGGTPPCVMTWYSDDLLAGREIVDSNLVDSAEHVFQIPASCDTIYSVFAVLEDNSGCSIEATGTVTLQDHETPLVRGIIADTTVDQLDHLPAIATTVSELEASGVSISDHCTMNSDLTVTTRETTVGECPIVVTRIYTIMDQCRNTSVINQVIKVQDTVLPTITCPESMITDCISNLPPVYNYTQFRLAGGIISDDRAVDTLSFALTSEYMMDSISSLEASVIRIYAISDQCGNEAQCFQPIEIRDTIAPDFTRPPDRWIHRKSDGTYNADPLIEDEVIDETDNCDTELNAMWSDRDTIETVLPGMMPELYAVPESYVVVYRIWYLEDNSGNRTEKEQKIMVYPVQNIICPADMEITLNYGMCDTVIGDIGTAFLESRDSNNILVSITNNAPANAVYPVGTTEVTWLVIDAYGNNFSCVQTIIVNYPPCGMDENYVAEDAEHRLYHTVRIDCDCWTQRNLESRYYSDGRRIESASGYYTSLYPDTAFNISVFGRLYNWYDAVDTAGGINYNSQGHIQGVCPSGWYLPAVEQYDALNQYGSSALKAPLYWLDGGGTNTTGFSSLPGGYYNALLHRFHNLMGNAYYWCSNIESQSLYSISMELSFDCEFFTENQNFKWNRYSIRCIKEKEE